MIAQSALISLMKILKAGPLPFLDVLDSSFDAVFYLLDSSPVK
jgi:hypothetical protein